MRKTRPRKTARNSMMDILARRDHSEKELRKKLKEKEFASSEIDSAIEFAKENRWLPNTPQENQALAEKFAVSLKRKGKGALYINHKLQEKGLPKVELNFEEELEKAMALVKTRWGTDNLPQPLSREQKAKLGRFLVSRGFAMDVVRKVIYEKL